MYTIRKSNALRSIEHPDKTAYRIQRNNDGVRMPNVIKKFMAAGIGGSLAYYIVDAILDEVITGTTAAENIFSNIVPLVIAAGVVWLIVSYAFAE